MTTQEFSDQFDVLYNNITSNLAPGLNEYEKSVFLTKALDEIVLAYFNQFDAGAKVLADFSNLIRTIYMTAADENTTPEDYVPFDPRATLFYIPNEYHNDSAINDAETSGYDATNHTDNIGSENFDNVLIIINEQVIKKNISQYHPEGVIAPNGIRQVIPVPFDEWTKLMSKPYKYPNKYQAWRLMEGRYDSGATAPSTDGWSFRRYTAILLNPVDKPIPSETAIEYVVRYVKKPRPIVLANFSTDGVSFSSDKTYNKITECELDPIVHHQILDRAVELAKAAWAVTGNKQLAQL